MSSDPRDNNNNNNNNDNSGSNNTPRRRRRPRRRPARQPGQQPGQQPGRQSETNWADEDDTEIRYSSSFWNYRPAEPEEEEIFWTITPGEKFRGYNDLPAKLKGPSSDNYKPANSFQEAGLSDIVLRNVEKSKYTQPTPVQKNAFPIISDDRDLMVCAQTGSGKTAAYLLPIISNLSKMSELPLYNEVASPLVLILVPTTELARQIHIDARRFAYKTNIRIVALYGGVDEEYQIQQLQSNCGCHLVVASPGRLITLLNPKEDRRGREISLEQVKYLVLDEADRMLVVDKKIGQEEDVAESGFYHDVQRLVSNYEMPAKEDRQTLMFSATFPKGVQEMAQEFLNKHLHLWIGKEEEGGTFSDIKQSVELVVGKSKRDRLVEILTEEQGKRIMVFVTTKNQAKKLFRYLKQSDFSVAEIHSDRVQEEREKSLRKFRGMKGEGESAVPIIVATSAASRGLDIEGVELVINYDLPDTDHVGIEEYIHKVGRTGRIGNTGRAISFFDPQKDEQFARSLVKVLADSLQEVPDWLEDIAMHALGTRIDASEEFKSQDIRD